MNKNANMIRSQMDPRNDFYTQLDDIENEMRHYWEHFRGKVVYCNCDDSLASNFTRYFMLKFDELGLKKLIAICYKNNKPTICSPHDCDQAAGIKYEGGG